MKVGMGWSRRQFIDDICRGNTFDEMPFLYKGRRRGKAQRVGLKRGRKESIGGRDKGSKVQRRRKRGPVAMGRAFFFVRGKREE